MNIDNEPKCFICIPYCSSTIRDAPAVADMDADDNMDIDLSSTPELAPTSSALTSARRQALLNTNMFVPSRAEKSKLDMAIAVFIASTCSPYSIVESDGFRHLMKVAAPNYEVPCRKTFSDRRIPALFVDMMDTVKTIISTAPFVSLTTDAWTAGNKRHFLGVTCAFINDDWELASYTLTCREADFSHTAENIATMLEEVMGDYNIDKNKVVAVTTDRAANMLAAVRTLGVCHVPCFAHVINSVVQKMMKHTTIAKVMQKVRMTYNIFSHSANANRALADIQREKKANILQMPSSCETRWWSELRQIEYVVDQLEVLIKFLSDYKNGEHQALLLEHSESRLLKDLKPLLQKLEAFGEKLSVEAEVTSSAIPKSVLQIGRLITDFRVNSAGADVSTLSLHVNMRREVSPIIGEVYDLATLETSHIDMAAYCDPRFERSNVAEMEAVVRLDAKHVHTSVPQVPDEGSNQEKGNLADLFGDDDATLNENTVSTMDPLEDELARYRCEPRLAYASNVLQWWKKRQGVYPVLAQVARKYLCMSATSVATERVFSTSGRVLTKYRLCLSGEHSEQLVFLAKNRDKLPMWR